MPRHLTCSGWMVPTCFCSSRRLPVAACEVSPSWNRRVGWSTSTVPYASLFTSFVVHVNRVGYEDGLNFWGGSTIFDPDGELHAKGPYYRKASLWRRSTCTSFTHARPPTPVA